MHRRDGCGLVVMGLLFVLACGLILAALTAALVQTGELPLYPPRLTGLEPELSFPFRPTTPITLTFDQPMVPESVEAALTFDPPLDGRFQWNDDASQVTFLPAGSGFEPGTSYQVELAASAQARTLPRTLTRGHQWSFSLPPLLAAVAPAPGTSGLGAAVVLSAEFGYPLECGATFQSFSISPNVNGVLGCKGKSLTFSPTEPLVPGTSYTARLDRLYLEGDPTARPGLEWTFQTAPPLMVTDGSPESQGFLTDYWVPFRITFNRRVDQESLSELVTLLLADTAPVPGQLRLEQGGSIAVFEPDHALLPASQYRLLVGPGVVDELGFELAAAVDREYATTPMLGTPWPLPGSQGVALDSQVRIPFTRPMDRDSVEAGLVLVPALEATPSWDEDTLVLDPAAGLSPETVYQITLRADVLDASGAQLGLPRKWAFATRPFLLEEHAPGGAPLEALAEPLHLSFALPVDRTSLGAALTISPTTPGALLWSDDDRAVTFQPDPGWLPGAQYSIALQGPVQTAGSLQTVELQRTYAFTTAVAEIRTGEGLRLEVLDAGGQRRLSFLSRGADLADLALFPLDQAQLLELLLTEPAGDAVPQSPLLDTTALTPTIQWRGVLTPVNGTSDGPWHPVETEIPGSVPAGTYLLAASPSAEKDGPLVIVLTRHLLMAKTTGVSLSAPPPGDGSSSVIPATVGDTSLPPPAILSGDQGLPVLLWHTTVDGSPVPSSTVRLYDSPGAPLAQGLTADDGLLLLDLPPGSGPQVALAELDGELTVCRLEAAQSDAPRHSRHFVYAYTDRSVYRPGETIHFRALIRLDDDATYSLPAPDRPVIVRVHDPRGNLAVTQVLTPGLYGTVHDEFVLARGSLLGQWHLTFDLAGSTAVVPIAVQESPPASFEATIRTPHQVYGWGQPISVTVAARHSFGLPLAAAEVMLEVFRLDGGSEPVTVTARLFDPPLVDLGGTDELGRWQALLPTDGLLAGLAEDRSVGLLLRATVAGPAGELVTTEQIVLVQPQARSLALELAEHGFQPGTEIDVRVAARDASAAPLPGLALTAQALGWDETVAAAATATSGPDGQATLTLSLDQQGLYRLLVTGDDDDRLQAESFLWIHDPEGLAPVHGGQFLAEPALTLLPDRTEVAVGGEVELAIYDPTGGPALFTVERGSIYHASVLSLAAGTNVITLPVRAEYAPNVHLTLGRFGAGTDLRWQSTSTQLSVYRLAGDLDLSLDLGSGPIAPGDELAVQLLVTDRQGRPVEAEVSLALIEATGLPDKAAPGELFEAFYGPRANSVRTCTTVPPADESQPPLGEPPAAGTRESWAPLQYLQGAFWLPDLVTDGTGRATAVLTLPDRLADWRLIARAISTDTLVGEASVSMAVSQTVGLYPVLPDYLVEGDLVDLAVELRNAGSQPLSVTLQLAVDGLVLAGEPRLVAHLPARDSSWVHWPLSASRPDGAALAGTWEASLAIQATATRGARVAARDSVALTLPVHRFAPPDLQVWSGLLTPAEPSTTVSFALDRSPISPTTYLQVRAWPSEAAFLWDGWAFLQEYPYPGAERAAGRVLATALARRAVAEHGLQNEDLAARLPAVMNLSLQELYAYQLSDGSWSWGGSDVAAVDQTARALASLAFARQVGFVIDGSVVEHGITALQLMLPELAPPDQANAAFALSLFGQPLSLTLTLTDALAMDPASQAALLLALDEALPPFRPEGAPELTATLLNSLRQAAIEVDGRVSWPAVDQAGQPIGPALGTTALVLDALLHLDPQSSLLAPAGRWLAEELARGGWGEPRQASYALLALADMLVLEERGPAGGSLGVTLNGEALPTEQIGPLDPGRVMDLPAGALIQGRNAITVALGARGSAPAAGQLYYALTLARSRDHGASPLTAHTEPERSVALQREYYLQGADEPATSFRQGDLVEVRLSLDAPVEERRVVVDHPLPAGFQVVDAPLSFGLAGARRGVYAGHVIFWLDHLPAGQTVLSYLVRPTVSGDLGAPAASLYLTDRTGIWSRSTVERIQVEMR